MKTAPIIMRGILGSTVEEVLNSLASGNNLECEEGVWNLVETCNPYTFYTIAGCWRINHNPGEPPKHTLLITNIDVDY